jgi:hypothetical protein
MSYSACSFKFIHKAGVEESIVNAPRFTCLNLTFCVCVFNLLTEWCVHNRLFNANFEDNFK